MIAISLKLVGNQSQNTFSQGSHWSSKMCLFVFRGEIKKLESKIGLFGRGRETWCLITMGKCSTTGLWMTVLQL